MSFLWSDAWLLQAIALASREGPASLAAVIAAADAVNHALPLVDELHGGFSRLTECGYVGEVAGRFSLGPRVAAETRMALLTGNAADGRRVGSALLDAEPWAPTTNVRDPRNAVRYPGLTDERVRAAEKEYRRRGPL